MSSKIVSIKSNYKKPVVVRMSDVEPEAVKWLWKPYIPAGTLTMLDGDAGAGKTFFALHLAAAISTGAGLPGPDGRPGEKRKAESVIYLTTENSLAKTIRPRLDAAGADASKVYILTGWETARGGLGQVTLKDAEVIEQVLEQYKPVLVVLDPIQEYLDARTDMHRANEVRPLLAKLSQLAEKHDAAVICTRHLNKSSNKAQYRGLGSIDFTAAARSVLLAGQDPADKNKRAIIQIKNSLAKIGSAIGYEITDEGNFLWAGLSDLTEEILLQQEGDGESRSAVKEAEEFLHELLKNGPISIAEIKSERAAAGISEKTLKRAKSNLNIKSKKVGNDWIWIGEASE